MLTNNSYVGAKVLLAQATGSAEDLESVREICQGYLNQPKSPKGRSHFMKWGSLRYASNAAFICLQVCKIYLKLFQLYALIFFLPYSRLLTSLVRILLNSMLWNKLSMPLEAVVEALWLDLATILL